MLLIGEEKTDFFIAKGLWMALQFFHFQIDPRKSQL